VFHCFYQAFIGPAKFPELRSSLFVSRFFVARVAPGKACEVSYRSTAGHLATGSGLLGIWFTPLDCAPCWVNFPCATIFVCGPIVFFFDFVRFG